jgi:tetratricopeptide (TPR) repeat protein
MALIRQLDRTDLLGRALNAACVVRTFTGDLPGAVRLATEALAYERSPRIALGINRSEAERMLGRYGQAVADATEALVAARHHRVHRLEALAHDTLGRVHLDAGNLDLARQHAERTLQLARPQGDAWTEAGALLTIGDVDRLRGLPHRATERYARAVRVAIGGGSRIHEAEARLALAVGDLTSGHPAQARERAAAAWDIARKCGLRVVECQLSHLFAAISVEQGRTAEAAEHAARAAAIGAETGYRPPPHLPTAGAQAGIAVP